ncbi:MAG: NADH:flavin oxidoreductase/NADH oxidase [Gemmatimonadetes bacterium]|nr:NADH:flavin oxidoreductase/NADH oxidase [Gemmatimonadota bacterium]
MSLLFTPIKMREVECRNRVFLAPMATWSAIDGVPTDWHLVHYGARAIGGAGLVMIEATAVSPEGRMSGWDTGLWSESHVEPFRRVTRFVKEHDAVPAVQLQHAGRKGSGNIRWLGGGTLSPEQGGWQVVAPSPIPYDDTTCVPKELTPTGIDRIVEAYRGATTRAVAAGFEVVEIHMAHGYLMHQFLSPLSNHRADRYGGSLENRARCPLRVAEAVRSALPERLPLMVRISATDWVDGGWDLEQSIEFSRWLKDSGVDLIDCSSGGSSPRQKVAPVASGPDPGYQVPFSAAIRKAVGIPTGAVGLITRPEHAESILARGEADVISLGRELLRNPHWPLYAARALGADIHWPKQYLDARLR